MCEREGGRGGERQGRGGEVKGEGEQYKEESSEKAIKMLGSRKQ